MSKSNLNRRQFMNRFAGRRRGGGGLRDRRDQVVGTGHRGQRHDPHRRRRAQRAGRSHVGEFATMPGVEITYLVDPDTRTYDKRLKQVESISSKAGKSDGRAPATVQDIRRVLDDKKVDAVSVATPNHWHSLMTIWACQAGKDVYVEKPCSHNVHEGRIAVEAARQYNRIVQHGTQSRSSQRMGPGRRGRSGRASSASSWSRGPSATSRAGASASSRSPRRPSELDFDIWLGPAPQAAVPRQPRPLQLALVLGFRQRRHRQPGRPPDGHRPLADPARSSGRERDLSPSRCSAWAAGSATSDQGQTANTQISVMDFGDTQLIFEVRGLQDRHVPRREGRQHRPSRGRHDRRRQVLPQGEDGGRAALEASVKVEATRGPGKGHFGNFIAAVRSRKVEDLNADILEGHYSAALCHLANISYRLGQEVPFNKSTEAFGDDKEAYETLARMEEHLKENKVALDGLNYRLGRKLTFDAATESFVGDSEANQLLTRHYRAPFVVPDHIA